MQKIRKRKMVSREIDQLKQILEFIKQYYRNEENSSLISIIEGLISSSYYKNQGKEILKKTFQFLLHFNLVILKASSTNSFRHYFPKELVVSNKLETFFELLKKTFKFIKVNIKILEPKTDKKTSEISYFYFEDYESIFRGLMYWDNNFVELSTEKILVLKDFMINSDIYLYFNNEYINLIFGEKGIIKNKQLPLTKFFNNVFDHTKYKRHSIYKWRKDKYFPICVIYDLYKSRYSQELEKDFLKYIEYIKIGKTQQISKELLNEIRLNYQDGLYKLITPSDSFLGYLLKYNPSTEDFNLLTNYNDFLQNYPKEHLEKLVLASEDGAKRDTFDDFINLIKEKVFKVNEDIYIKELKIINFKSYQDETIHFQKGINILWGLNGSGKTTILDAIFFALFIPSEIHTNFKLKRLYPLELDFLDTHYIHVGKESCEVSLVLKRKGEEITIVRKIWKDGRHRIFINNIDITQKIDIRDHEIWNASLLNIEIYEKKNNKTFPKKVKYRKEMDDFLLGLGGIRFEIRNAADRFETELLDSIEEKEFINEFILHTYFSIIVQEIENVYKEMNCFFEFNDIYSAFFLEFKSIFNFFVNPSMDLEEFYLEKFNLKFLDKIAEDLRFEKKYHHTQYSQEVLDLIKFLEDTLEFLYDQYLLYVNQKFEKFTKENFKDAGFTSFLDDYGIPIIKFNQTNEDFPINVLSGGEKSKLIIGLLSILIEISNKTSFFLIDEPNELLDSNNVEIMKQFFFELFKNKQLIISTFVDRYKDFQPASVFEVWKDHNKVSHVFHFEDKEKFELYKELDEIEKKVEQNPKDYYNYQRKLVLLIKLNHYEEALDFYQNIKTLVLDVFKTERLESYLKNIIKHKKEKEKSKEIAAKYYRNRALIFYDLKELHQAIENADEALKLEKIPEFYDFKAHSLYLRNKPNKALETIEEGIKLFPDYTGFHKTKSAILEILGKYEEALTEIDNAIKINKDENWNYYHKALVLTKSERFSKALENLDKAYKNNPHDFVYIQDKVNILEKLNRVDEALELLKKEKDNFPEFKQFEAQLYQTKSYQLANSNKKEEAIETIKKAITIDPEEANFYNTYGEIYMIFKQYDEAFKQFEIAKKLYFTPIETYINMGICLYELGRYEEALENLEIGKSAAEHSVKKGIRREDDKKITVDDPQNELIEEAEEYISKIKKRLNEK